ncbi:transcription factor IIIA [Aquila chrysaetos chrysaetos]|uniref:transcription factor IIIA n=1 Tax=Aquila chrysaetos chrysaetos TaxID=223781 RepID=UPI001176BDA6|nr:transcription factor IIIA [Aquila chrysaetos chrysaetos]
MATHALPTEYLPSPVSKPFTQRPGQLQEDEGPWTRWTVDKKDHVHTVGKSWVPASDREQKRSSPDSGRRVKAGSRPPCHAGENRSRGHAGGNKPPAPTGRRHRLRLPPDRACAPRPAPGGRREAGGDIPRSGRGGAGAVTCPPAWPGSGRRGARAAGERSPPPRPFICSFPGCDATFNKAWRLDAHLCRHTGERPYVCHYEGCGKGFTRDFHRARHLLTHTGEKPFECTADGCNQKFGTKSNLKKHIERKHQNRQKQYVCDFEGCNKSFRKHQQLKVHQCHHTNEPPFKCNNEGCGKHFSTPSRLKRHEKIHEGYACKKENCSYTGKTWTELLKHNKVSHTEPIVCSECYKTFKRKDYLKQHQKTHAVEREVCQCPREGCGRTYTTIFNLQSHILSFHEEKKPFSCDYPGCGRVFAMKQSLARHAVVHDPEKRKMNLKAKRSRPKRSLASRLSGYIPPKTQPGKNAVLTESKAVDKPIENEIPTVEILTLQ